MECTMNLICIHNRRPHPNTNDLDIIVNIKI